MLCLQSRTDRTFVDRFEADTEQMLIDHAHCERKAAAAAFQWLTRHPNDHDLAVVMTTIVEEEMEHFGQVLRLLEARGWRYRNLPPSRYAGRLHKLCRTGDETDVFVDKMIVCALIEARSCERFSLLGEHLQDEELRAFYQSLFVSEARHYATYLKLAIGRHDEDAVRARLAVMAAAEAEINARGEAAPRLHA